MPTISLINGVPTVTDDSNKRIPFSGRLKELTRKPLGNAIPYPRPHRRQGSRNFSRPMTTYESSSSMLDLPSKANDPTQLPAKSSRASLSDMMFWEDGQHDFYPTILEDYEANTRPPSNEFQHSPFTGRTQHDNASSVYSRPSSHGSSDSGPVMDVPASPRVSTEQLETQDYFNYTPFHPKELPSQADNTKPVLSVDVDESYDATPTCHSPIHLQTAEVVTMQKPTKIGVTVVRIGSGNERKASSDSPKVVTVGETASALRRPSAHDRIWAWDRRIGSRFRGLRTPSVSQPAISAA